MNHHYGYGYDVSATVEVEATTLDELTDDYGELSIIKIDVQGHERDVLQGGSAALTRTRWLLLEVNYCSHYEGDLLFPDLHAIMMDAGFQLMGLSDAFVGQDNIYLWADALYGRLRV